LSLAELLTAKPPPIREDTDGALRIGKTRVSLDSVLSHYNSGASAEEIVSAFPSVTLEEVHAAVSFYLGNQAEVDAYIADGEKQGDRIQTGIERRFPIAEIRNRILTRREKRLSKQT
jgi:uncharacterized protein (DUF433 family)